MSFLFSSEDWNDDESIGFEQGEKEGRESYKKQVVEFFKGKINDCEKLNDWHTNEGFIEMFRIVKKFLKHNGDFNKIAEGELPCDETHLLSESSVVSRDEKSPSGRTEPY